MNVLLDPENLKKVAENGNKWAFKKKLVYKEENIEPFVIAETPPEVSKITHAA